MRVGTLILVLVLASSAWARPPQDPVRTEPIYGVVGFTSDVFTGDLGGPFGAKAKCQAEFPESRMCRAAEAIATSVLPSPRPAFAWINLSPGDGHSTSALAVGNIVYGCNYWTNPSSKSGNGMVIRANGKIETKGCAFEYPIACCAPLP